VRTVSIIGAGRVGGAFALGLSRGPYKIERLVYRSDPARAREIAERIEGLEIERIDEARRISSDVVLITTQDSELSHAAKWLAGHIDGSATVYHTSGALSSAIFSGLAAMGCGTGSIHPLVSVSNPGLGLENFRNSYFCLEGDANSIAEAERVVATLGGIPFTIDTQYKTLYHAAAVTACGHLVALFDAAVEMMTKCGLDAVTSKTILMPLVRSTVRNLSERSTGEALTGTFARADVETFVRHLQALNTGVSEELLEIYLLLGERSLELASKQGVSVEKIETLRTKVAIAKSKLKW
jgi:predicted short-subunit dehydrogenase-like oxidoreductase (DUF2520 family)